MDGMKHPELKRHIEAWQKYQEDIADLRRKW